MLPTNWILNFAMRLVNITVEHFATADGKGLLSVDQNGFPQISGELASQEERALAAIALAIYSNCAPLHASEANVALVAQWVRQFKYPG